MTSSVWETWLRRPKTLGLRRALFQAHLWCGLTLGLYVVVLSVTGSLLVFRPEMERALIPRVEFEAGRKSIGSAGLRAAAERAHPGWTVTRIGAVIRRQNAAVEIWIERDGVRLERHFDPYTGADLGDRRPPALDALDVVSSIHDSLLAGEEWGSAINVAGGALVTLLALSGLVVWWPGIDRWRRSLTVRRSPTWARVSWDVHSALGFWSSPLIAIWGLSGLYLAYPDPFVAFVDRISDPQAILGQRPGDKVIAWLVLLHFGRFEGAALKAAWVVIGLAPAVMAATAAVMWWTRAGRRTLGGSRPEPAPAVVSPGGG